MKTLMTTLLAAASCVVLTFTAPVQAAATSETRAVADFEAISIAGAMDLTVRQGARESVEIQADQKVLPLIETVVDNKTLKIRFKRGESMRSHGSIKVTVDVIRLTAIASSGSGDVVVEALKTPSLKLGLAGASDAKLRKLDTDNLEVRIAGSGDIAAAGVAKQVKLSISGSGEADLAGLVADDVSIRIAGSGDANVTANRSLDVSIAGSGDVRYGGTVTAVKSSMAGSGSVNRR